MSVPSGSMQDSSLPSTSWSGRDLLRPLVLLGALSTFAFVALAAMAVSCNVHELGHAAVASALGWEVERVNFCLPGGGGVEYARIGRWAYNAQGYAGGLLGAASLLAVYVMLFERRERPLLSARWWAAGLGVVLWIGLQVLLGFLEGFADLGTDYTERFTDLPQVLIPLTVAAVAVGPAAFIWRWRAVWFRSPGHSVP